MTRIVNEAYHASCCAAARVYARANETDPFAFGRMMAHLTLGIVQPHEVLAQWQDRTPEGKEAKAKKKEASPTRAVVPDNEPEETSPTRAMVPRREIKAQARRKKAA